MTEKSRHKKRIKIGSIWFHQPNLTLKSPYHNVEEYGYLLPELEEGTTAPSYG